MKRVSIIGALVASAFLPMAYLAAHCEVPCGIYDDEARLQQLVEDHSTIAKAIGSMRELAAKPEVQSMNQIARWVATKETHATHMQQVIAQYFMTQRIKSDDKQYVEKLTAAHAVMLAAMKCKQSSDPATAEALAKAVNKFHDVYSGHTH